MATTAFPALPEDKLRTIDQLRQRLSQLSTSLSALKVDLERNEPMPTWPSLQMSAQIVSHNLSQTMATFESHREFLRSAHAYPMTSFPGHTQEGLLNQLLRKRLEPSVEEWIKKYDKPMQDSRPGQLLSDQELQQLWAKAGPTSTDVVREMVQEGAFDDDFSLAERKHGVENVITGLRRKLRRSASDDTDDDEEDEAEDDAQKMEDVHLSDQESNEGGFGVDVKKVPLPLERVLIALSTGRLPD